MTDHTDVIAAFLDNEPVEAPALAEALEDADARGYFMDLLVMRGLVGDAAVQRPLAIQASRAAAVPTTRRRAAAWLTAAAALVVAGTAAGYVTGRSGTNVVVQQTATPVVNAADSASAPAPTYVIRFENGVNWNERSGGK